MKMILRSLAFLSLIVHVRCIAFVSKTSKRAHGRSLPGQGSDDEEVVRVVEADVVGEQELNAQPPAHDLSLTAAKTRIGDGADDAEQVADNIEKESQNTDATLATSVGSNAEDEEVVKVVDADVVQAQANESDAQGADETGTKDEQDDGDDDDDDSDDETQIQGTHVKPHPSAMQMKAPKIKLAKVAVREVASSNMKTAKASVREVESSKIKTAKVAVLTNASSKQATNVAVNASKPQVQLAAVKKNLRSPEANNEEQMDSDSTAPEPKETAEEQDEPSQTPVEEMAIAMQDEAPVHRSRSDCDEGSEFNENDC